MLAQMKSVLNGKGLGYVRFAAKFVDEIGMEISNQRKDEYGGSIEKRLTAARKIVEGIKAECGQDFPVSIRLGMKSWIKGFEQASMDGSDEAGRTIEEACEIGRLLESYGYDMLDVNSGIYDSFYYLNIIINP